MFYHHACNYKSLIFPLVHTLVLYTCATISFNETTCTIFYRTLTLYTNMMNMCKLKNEKKNKKEEEGYWNCLTQIKTQQ